METRTRTCRSLSLPLLMIIHAFSRVLLVLFLYPAGSDVPLYHKYATGHGRGDMQLPYRDFRFEYPPLAYIPIVLPSVLNPDGPPNEYRLLFRTQMAICEIIAVALLALTVRRRRPGMGMEYVMVWGCLIQGLALAPLLVDRLDAGVLLSVAVWAYGCARALEEDSQRANGNGNGNGGAARMWTGLAAAALGLGVAFKWVPIVAVPFFAWEMGKTHPLAVILPLTITMIGPFALSLAVAGPGTFEFLSYNATRGLEIESIWASILLFLQPRRNLVATQGPGSWDLCGIWADRLAHLSMAFLLTICALVFLRMLFRHRHHPPSPIFAYRIPLLAIILLGTTSKVLSPQYLVWILPPLTLAAAEVVPNKTTLKRLVILGTLVAMATTWIFPYHFVGERTWPKRAEDRVTLIFGKGRERQVDMAVGWLLIARNVTLVWLIVSVGLPLASPPG